jgi:microcystin degradation protein MlrC
MGNGVWQNYGPSMLFRAAGLDIAVISNNGQLLDLAQLQSLGVDPHYKSVIVVKSNHHFRASLTALSKEIVTVDGGGLGHMILIGGNYVNVRRPIWPLDNI